jgi:hypothetical protein
MSSNVVPKIVIRDSSPKVLSREKNLTVSNPHSKSGSAQKPTIPDWKTARLSRPLPTSYPSADSDGECQHSNDVGGSGVPNEEEYLQTLVNAYIDLTLCQLLLRKMLNYLHA